MSDAIVLHQFPFSHFNEKARWGLAFKKVAHKKENYLPGRHATAIRELSGQTSTPVLEVGSKVVAGSAEILAVLEETYPNHPLVPKDELLAKEALALQKQFDDELGPAVRAASFSVLLDEGSYIPKMFGSPQPLPMRLIYRMVFPFAKSKVERAYKTNDEGHIAECIVCVDRSLDEISESVQQSGFLVGDTFTIADLTAASLLAPVVNPHHPEMKRPEPQPQRMLDFTEGWRAHEAAGWVRRMYREYR